MKKIFVLTALGVSLQTAFADSVILQCHLVGSQSASHSSFSIPIDETVKVEVQTLESNVFMKVLSPGSFYGTYAAISSDGRNGSKTRATNRASSTAWALTSETRRADGQLESTLEIAIDRQTGSMTYKRVTRNVVEDKSLETQAKGQCVPSPNRF